MPSTREQKAREERPRHLDVMFDMKNAYEMLGRYSRNGLESDQDERNFEFIRSSINTDSREKTNEIALDTSRMIKNEINTQVKNKFGEIKSSLKSQIIDSNISAIVENVLPSIQNTTCEQDKGCCAKSDQSSSSLHIISQVENGNTTNLP